MEPGERLDEMFDDAMQGIHEQDDMLQRMIDAVLNHPRNPYAGKPLEEVIAEAPPSPDFLMLLHLKQQTVLLQNIYAEIVAARLRATSTSATPDLRSSEDS